MLNLEDIINNSEDVRELKRAIAVNMSAEGAEVKRICEALKVSDSYVSKWKIIYEKEGAEGLLMKYIPFPDCLNNISAMSEPTSVIILYNYIRIL